MEKKWEGLSPDEKKEELFKRWLSPPGVKFVSPKTEKLYKERVTRIKDAIQLKKMPDRVPVFPIVGLSGFLALAFDSMKQTIQAIKDAGLRDKVKVMIGGGQITEEIRKYTGADAYGKDAMAGVSLAKKWVGAD